MLHTIQELQMRQRLPLEAKVAMSKSRIREWINEYGEDGVYISFSGGKDSTVLLNIVREDYPGVKAVFVDTGLEYPEIREFVKTFDNVDIVKPKRTRENSKRRVAPERAVCFAAMVVTWKSPERADSKE